MFCLEMGNGFSVICISHSSEHQQRRGTAKQDAQVRLPATIPWYVVVRSHDRAHWEVFPRCISQV